MPEALGPPAAIEVDYHGTRPLADGNRLGFAGPYRRRRRHRRARVEPGPPPGGAQADLDLATVVVDPSFRLFYAVVPPAELGHGASAAASRRVRRADAARPHDASRPSTGRCSPALHGVLAARDGEVTVAVHEPLDGRPAIVAAWPGYVDAAHGIALDVGSTTIAGHLCDLATGEVLATAGRMNPQIRFGEDLMSRVSYVMMNPGGDRRADESGAARDRRADRRAVRAAGTYARPRARDRARRQPDHAPPRPGHRSDAARLGAVRAGHRRGGAGRAAELDLDAPNARWYVGPCIAGHVGADTSAAILAEGPHRATATQLLVDVGTNAEIVLGDDARLFAASSPTGPAFEGAQISCGQRATAGAIERVRIDPETYEPRVRVIGCDACGRTRPGSRPPSRGSAARGSSTPSPRWSRRGIVDTDGRHPR